MILSTPYTEKVKQVGQLKCSRHDMLEQMWQVSKAWETTSFSHRSHTRESSKLVWDDKPMSQAWRMITLSWVHFYTPCSIWSNSRHSNTVNVQVRWHWAPNSYETSSDWYLWWYHMITSWSGRDSVACKLVQSEAKHGRWWSKASCMFIRNVSCSSVTVWHLSNC